MIKDNPEILAPAGSFETLEAALKSGADAVYVGGEKYSARNSAANFSEDELLKATELCHLYGAKLYLAVNTIISDDEAEDFCRYIKKTARIGVDAYIVQDLGCAYLIRKCVPDAVLHASTQMSVHTACGAELVRSLGFSRVVPARELDKAVIDKICKTGIETEIFVHGALCMSVSGQCYMSAVMGSRSANRGCCGQACRLPFSAVGNKSNNSLSLKDLSLLPCISQVKDIGVDSLKIEGRMKRPEYVASAVDALKTALDGGNADMQTLRGIFSRGGFTDGYFTGKRFDMFGTREKNDVVAAQELIPKTHELYRFHRKTRSISFHAVVKKDTPLSVTAFCDGLSAEAFSEDCPQTAINRPADLTFLEKQLSKLGDTVFSLDKVTADIDDGLAVSAGKINELRRVLVEKISGLIISRENPGYTVTDYSPETNAAPIKESAALPIRVFCRTAEQVKAALQLADYVILDSNLALSEPIITANPEITENPDRIILSPPRFICDEEKVIGALAKMRDKFGFSRLLCHTPDSIAIGKKLGFTLHGEFGLNVFNSFSAKVLAKLGLADITASFEAKFSQINRLSSSVAVGGIISGRLPLMLTRNCPIKNEVGCKNCTGALTDRTGRILPVICKPDYTEILNCNTLYIQDKPEKLRSLSFGIIMLGNESFSEAKSLIKGEKPRCDITNGLYQRGIL